MPLQTLAIGAQYTYSAGWTSQNQYPRMVEDLNPSDFLDDIVGFGRDGVWVSQATLGGSVLNPTGSFAPARMVSSEFAYASGWTSRDHFPRMLADDVDGRADIVGFGLNGVWLSRNVSVGDEIVFSLPQLVSKHFGYDSGWTSQNQFPRTTGDINADGLDDVVGFGQAGVWTSLGVADAGYPPPSLALSRFGYADGWTSQNQFPRMLGDVDGDMREDIVGFGYAGVWVSLAAPTGGFQAPMLASNAFGYDSGWTSQDQFPRMLGDVNNDGRADVIAFGLHGVWTSLANANGTFAAPTFESDNFGYADGWTSQDQYPRLVANYHVPGIDTLDLWGFGSSNVWAEWNWA